MIAKRNAVAGSWLIALAICVAISPAARAVPASHAPYTYHQKIALRKPLPIYPHAAAAGSAQTYTIVDVGGASAGSGYTLNGSTAFNNAGQIVGSGYTPNYTGVCVLFDGSVFRNIGTLPSITSCSANGISEASAATGALEVVGSAVTEFSDYVYADEKALYVTITPKSGVIRTAVFTNDQSSLLGVNAAGKAFGVGDYYPLAGFVTSAPPFVVSPGQGTLALLQPACTTLAFGCGELPTAAYTEIGLGNGCGFGGCRIAADGTLLLYDLFTGSFEFVAPSGTARDVALDANVDSVPLMNAAKQLTYAVETVVAGAPVIRTQLYSSATGKFTTVPPLAGTDCSQYVPLSLNNAGRVLGYAECTPAMRTIYFTFDPATGTQALPSSLPGNYFSVTPHAINDKNQILVDLQLSNGGLYHWGYLQPAVAASRVRATGLRPAAVAAVPTSVRFPEAFTASTHAREAIATRAPRARSTERRVPLQAALGRATSPTYTLVDYGAPPAASYTLDDPVAFNNDGQVIGVATDVPYRNGSSCLLFDGSKYRNLGSGSIVGCDPLSLSDENPSTGSVNVVGESTSAYDAPGDKKAFFTRVTLQTGAIATQRFAGYDLSFLAAVNTAGMAVGEAVYTPAGLGTQPIFELLPGKNVLTLLAACAGKPGCGGLGDFPCPFGGCIITADGTLFIGDVLISPDGTERRLNFGDNSFGQIINNNGQILYQDRSNTEIYSLMTGKATLIPRVPGGHCALYAPISFNNAGHVLGAIRQCTNSTGSYYVYDPANGTRDLATELPSVTSALLPLAINDKDQILVALTLPNGIVHWGILSPPAAGSVRHRAARSHVAAASQRL